MDISQIGRFRGNSNRFRNEGTIQWLVTSQLLMFATQSFRFQQ